VGPAASRDALLDAAVGVRLTAVRLLGAGALDAGAPRDVGEGTPLPNSIRCPTN